MLSCETLESSKDFCSKDSDDNMSESSILKFYTPVCASGYLTPLQRKKLREKRKICSPDLNDSNTEETKKSNSRKRKYRTDPFIPNKNKTHIKRMKTEDKNPQVQCTVAKIVFRHNLSPENVKTKKFFKSSSSDRLEKANFTMPLVLKKNVFSNINKYVKETLSHAKRTSQSTGNNSCDRITPDDFDNSEHVGIRNNSMLHSKEEIPVQNSLSKFSLSDAEKCIFEFDWPSDEELIKRQENARMIFKRENVLKQANGVYEKRTDNHVNSKQSIKGNQVKLYPVFLISKKSEPKTFENAKRKNSFKKIKDSSKGGEQMIIDAGQKEIGPKFCCTCNMLYAVGQEDDERLHLNYHDMYLINLKFHGWKDENVIGEYCDGRVILIRKTDKNFMLKKVEDVLQVANRDLGFPSTAMPSSPDLTFLLFISNDKRVAGCLIAEPISKAFQVLLGNSKSAHQDKVWSIGNWYANLEATPAVCGVNRIWVAHNFRRQKIASRMVDCLRCHFIHGHVISIREIAFTDPSPAGREFAAAYTGTDNFLVYK